MKEKLLKKLRESQGYVSGQELCESFGVSRTAVWKLINQLKTEGYVITAVQNKGYFLEQSPDLVTKEEIRSRLNTQWAGRSVVSYDCVGSTNLEAKHLAEDGAAHGTLVVADCQSAGKGRRGRLWESPKGQSIYMTLIIKDDIRPENASSLTLVMALAVAEGVEQISGLPARIKWPNDVLIHEKKICGILTEMSAQIDYVNYIVTGVGINMGKDSFDQTLASKATSLKIETETEISRAELIAVVLEKYEYFYELYQQNQDMSLLMDAYHKKLINLDREVSVLDPKGAFSGRSKGINKRGELLVEKEDGSEVLVYAGEVSVRGTNGYV